MAKELLLKETKNLPQKEKREILEVVDKTIEQYRNNNAKINKLAFDSITALTANQARIKELKNQGVLKRTWQSITGQNQRIQAQLEANQNQILYASQKMIERLRDENLLSLELITAVNNKFNGITLRIDKELRDIWNYVGDVREELREVEKRLDNVERNMRLMRWSLSLKSSDSYSELNLVEKIVWICSDFFNITKGEWDKEDILLIKNALKELDLSLTEKISLEEFYLALSNDHKLFKRLFKGVSVAKLDLVKTYQAPLLKGGLKIKKLATQNRKEKLTLIRKVLRDNLQRKPDFKLSIFDLIVDLLFNLSIISTAEELEIKAEAKDGMVIIRAGKTRENNKGLALDYDLEVGKYPVTNKEYLEFLNKVNVTKRGNLNGQSLIKLASPNIKIAYNGDSFYLKEQKATKEPVVYVSYYGAVAYCNYLSKQEGFSLAYDEASYQIVTDLKQLRGYRLPSSKEWGYIARGGDGARATKYAGSDKLNRVAWAGEREITTVGKKEPNELGVYDLSGNVWEWTSSDKGSKVVRRGGSWRGSPGSCRISNTVSSTPEKMANTIGFRVVRTR